MRETCAPLKPRWRAVAPTSQLRSLARLASAGGQGYAYVAASYWAAQLWRAREDAGLVQGREAKVAGGKQGGEEGAHASALREVVEQLFRLDASCEPIEQLKTLLSGPRGESSDALLGTEATAAQPWAVVTLGPGAPSAGGVAYWTYESCKA
jgi:hypothetical protein